MCQLFEDCSLEGSKTNSTA